MHSFPMYCMMHLGPGASQEKTNLAFCILTYERVHQCLYLCFVQSSTPSASDQKDMPLNWLISHVHGQLNFKTHRSSGHSRCTEKNMAKRSKHRKKLVKSWKFVVSRSRGASTGKNHSANYDLQHHSNKNKIITKN